MGLCGGGAAGSGRRGMCPLDPRVTPWDAYDIASLPYFFPLGTNILMSVRLALPSYTFV